MGGFQLAGPAADVSKILYGESRKSYRSPNAQYNFDHKKLARVAAKARNSQLQLGEDQLDEQHTVPMTGRKSMHDARAAPPRGFP
jgi:hypothetical protein